MSGQDMRLGNYEGLDDEVLWSDVSDIEKEVKKLKAELKEAREVIEDVALTGEHAIFCRADDWHKCKCMDRNHFCELGNSMRAREYLLKHKEHP